MPHLIVFSHLRWAFVFQRPQHLLSRLARHFHVVFVEEPMHTSGPAYLERTTPCTGIEVLRPHTPVEAGGFHDDQLSALQPMIAGYLADNLIDEYLVWFYTPMALPLLGDLTPRAIVYDCMDELSAFKNAPRQMRQRETRAAEERRSRRHRRAAPVRGQAPCQRQRPLRAERRRRRALLAGARARR